LIRATNSVDEDRFMIIFCVFLFRPARSLIANLNGPPYCILALNLDCRIFVLQIQLYFENFI